MMPLLAATTIADYLSTEGLPLVGPLSGWLALAVAAAIHAGLVGAFFGLPAAVFIWVERKLSGRIQDRLGPTRVGGRFGWLQIAADGGKLIQKEDLAPGLADSMLFRVAPYIVVVASFAAYMFIPFSEGWTAVVMDCGLFVALAVLSLEVLGVVLAGYSSGSKWSLFGGMRETAQMVSYEVPLGITAVIPVAVVGSMNLNDIAFVQYGGIQNWLLFHDPFTFLAFFVFFVVTLASNKRAPFDLAEAESELVAGFLTEYSGMRWSLFFLGEYAAMFFVSALAVLLFLGGWWSGIPQIDNLFLSLSEGSFIGGVVARIAGMKIFLVKSTLLVCVQVWVRWTLPRLRIDQVMTTCLKYLVPISCFLFLGAISYPLILSAVIQRTTLGEPAEFMGIRYESLGERFPVPQRSVPAQGESAKVGDVQGVGMIAADLEGAR
jgi:NADH-quinone oxidoreductase subunit H